MSPSNIPGPRAAFTATAAMRAILAGLAMAALPQASRGLDGVGRVDSGAALAGIALPSPTDTTLAITFLDVGQGDAVLIRAPEGQTALVDAGRRDIVPLLREMGVDGIDLLVATHPHADHIGGMAAVIRSMPVRFYMDSGQPHTTATYRGLLAALEARPEITYLEAVPRTISLGSAEIEVLPLLPRATTDLNNRSVALVVRFGSFTALLSGDSEVQQLTHLVGRGVVPAVTLLKAPHHGSDNGFTWPFLEAARPEVVVISVGRNGYGHPRPAALRAYADVGATVLRTDLAGHVAILGYEHGDFGVARGEQVAAVMRAGGGQSGSEDVVADAVVGAGSAAGAPGGVSAADSGADLRLSVYADAPGNDNRNPNGEYVVIQNLGAVAQAIGGWRLCDLANHCFSFPAGAVLAAGATITLYSGPGRSDGNRYHMGYRRAVWNNNGDTATLYDERGAVVVAYRY
ncbi:MAG: lamin tail domain-containing protein [Gemmatimonadota bacterium]|nr:lamin tail domain-containing protein [Gemmatimonadota bacterium]